MIKHFKHLAAAFMLALTIVLTPAAVVTAAGLSTTDLPGAQTFASLKDEACQGLRQVESTQGCGANSTAITNIVRNVIRIFSYIIGIAAVIALLLAGLKYVTAAGDSNKISSAKSTLVYALIGLVVVALAQFLVNFVFKTASESINSAPAATSQASGPGNGATKAPLNRVR